MYKPLPQAILNLEKKMENIRIELNSLNRMKNNAVRANNQGAGISLGATNSAIAALKRRLDELEANYKQKLAAHMTPRN